jgi:CDP-paratose 2-epimerase
MLGLASDPRPVLITGGCGFIGSNMAHEIAGRGQTVLVLDSLVRDGSRENAHWLKTTHSGQIEIKRADVRDQDAVLEAVSSAKAVLHLAGQVAVTTSLENPVHDFETNARGTLNVLEAVRTKNPEIPLLFASTNKVYGRVLDHDDVRRDGQRYRPAELELQGICESVPLDFHSPYGCSKGAADQYVRDYARVFGLRATVMRMSCVYGPRQFGTEDQGWIAHFFIQAIRNQAIIVFGDGYQVRDALHVDDAVSAWLTALDQIDRVRGEVFNLGGGPENSVSLRELLDVMGAMGRSAADVKYRDWRPGDQPWYVSDISKLSRKLSWRPRTSLQAGLKSLDAWLSIRFGHRPEPALAGGWR